jgi:hypothetical protein
MEYRMRRIAWALVTLALLLGGTGYARAGVLYTLNDNANGVSATALFQTVAGGIEITVTNTESNTADAAHAISQIRFTVGGGLSLPSSFTKIAGTTTDFSGTTKSITVSPPTSTEYWSFQSGGTTVSLWTVDGNGLNGYGGQPNHLIVAAGSTPNASLTNTHLPSFIGPVNFFLAASSVPSNLTKADITGVKFSFGTQPEVSLDKASGSDDVVAPEPSTILGAVTASLLGLGYAWRRRTAKTA